MYSYITQELPAIIDAHFPADPARQGIFGHSMGGHGAITIGLKNPGSATDRFPRSRRSSAPKQVPWGQKALHAAISAPTSGQWEQYDSTELMSEGDGCRRGARRSSSIRGWRTSSWSTQLHPHLLEEAARRQSGYAVTLRRQPGYDHGYYFISTFMDDHLRHHANESWAAESLRALAPPREHVAQPRVAGVGLVALVPDEHFAGLRHAQRQREHLQVGAIAASCGREALRQRGDQVRALDQERDLHQALRGRAHVDLGVEAGGA